MCLFDTMLFRGLRRLYKTVANTGMHNAIHKHMFLFLLRSEFEFISKQYDKDLFSII